MFFVLKVSFNDIIVTKELLNQEYLPTILPMKCSFVTSILAVLGLGMMFCSSRNENILTSGYPVLPFGKGAPDLLSCAV
jgi:hypothetical protein